jgi:hypothetical protein
VTEGGTASADLLGRFVQAKSDLSGERFSYVVTDQGTQPVNGPLPVNAKFDVNAVVKNKGFSRAGAFTAAFYASVDRVIDPTTDARIGAVAVPSALEPGQRVTVRAPLKLPNRLPKEFFGKITIGMVIEPDDPRSDANIGNNRNVGEGIDRRRAQFYDPIAPRGVWKRNGSTLYFSTRRAAEQFLERQGFAAPLIAGVTDIGFSRPVGPTYSRFTGTTMRAGAFRIQAGVAVKNGRFYIVVQGAAADFNPAHLETVVAEPSPRALLHWRLNFPYVRDYHNRF